MIIQEILTAPSNDPREELDSILARCCEAVLDGQAADSEFYGMVGACVVCPDGQLVYGVNYRAEDGRRVHAERAALERCDNVTPDCIIVTTLSPCNRPMDERSGESCEDLIAEYGIEHVYSGYKDPTQEGDDSIETRNEKLRELCKRFADTFLDEARKKKRKSRGGGYFFPGYGYYGGGVGSSEGGDGGGGESKSGIAEGSESYPEVLYHGSTQEINGPLTPRQASDIGGAKKSNKNAIYATDDPNFAIAYSLAERGSDTGTFGWKKDPHLIFFGGKIRHGQNVYLHILPTRDEQGRPLFVRGAADAEWYSRPGVKEVTPTEVKPLPVDQYLHLLREPTPKEQKIFQANKAKQDMAENFADGKVKGKSRPGRVKRAGASCNGSVTDLRARAKKASGERARMYHWCANMKSGKKK
jgi:pyrimidine deaminase RibD-like protein